jgi:hypothetical protein
MKMDFLAKALKKFHLCVFYATCWSCGIFHRFEYYGLRETSYGNCTKIEYGAGTNVIAGLATGMISTFPTVFSSNLDSHGFMVLFGCFAMMATKQANAIDATHIG